MLKSFLFCDNRNELFGGRLILRLSAGVANCGALRQIWRIACLGVAHSRFKIFRAIWVSVLSSGRKICHSNNISKKKSLHAVGLAFGGIFKPKVMEKVHRNRG